MKKSNEKDKFLGILGIVLFFLSLACLKVSTVYNIELVNEFITILVFSILSLIGIVLSKRYFNILFGAK